MSLYLQATSTRERSLAVRISLQPDRVHFVEALEVGLRCAFVATAPDETTKVTADYVRFGHCSFRSNTSWSCLTVCRDIIALLLPGGWMRISAWD